MTEKQQLQSFISREMPITIKVLRAFPADQQDYKPAAISRSAKELGLTFTGEAQLLLKLLESGELDFASMHAEAATWDEVVSKATQTYNKLLHTLEATDEDRLMSLVSFGGHEMRIWDVVHVLTCDAIHHRGQFSVYLRLVGAKVPAMYGPSADEQ